MDPLLFSVADAAPLLAVKETRLRELIDAGLIATVRHGPRGDLLLRRCDLEAYVASLRPAKKGEPTRLPTVTNQITNGRQPQRRLAGARGLPTVKAVRYDPADED